MNFSAAFLKIVFLASTLVAATPLIPAALEHRAPTYPAPVGSGSGVDIVMWTGKYCDGSAQFFYNVPNDYPYEKYPLATFHSMEIRKADVDGIHRSIELGDANCRNLAGPDPGWDQPGEYYVYGRPGCAQNIIGYSCFVLVQLNDLEETSFKGYKTNA